MMSDARERLPWQQAKMHAVQLGEGGPISVIFEDQGIAVQVRDIYILAWPYLKAVEYLPDDTSAQPSLQEALL